MIKDAYGARYRHGQAPTRYVNVYLVDRCYGGPEEGGWYYDAGAPIYSHKLERGERARDLVERFERRFAHLAGRYGRSSVIGGPDVEVRIEREPAKAFPAVRPVYC